MRLWVAAFACLCLISCSESTPGKRTTDSGLAQQALVRPEVLYEGDVIFRRGTGLWSPMISGTNESRFSHIGVMVRKEDRWFVAHADAHDLTWQGGVHLTDLDEFLAESAFFRVKRNAMQAASKQQFLEFILKHVELATKFDSDFTIDESAKELYCTEYIWLAGLAAGVRLGEPTTIMGKLYITLDAIYQSDYLS